MSTVNDWLVRIDSALKANFKQKHGPSRPGTDYMIGLKCGTQEFRTLVRAYLSDDLTAAARRDEAYQGQTVIGYVFDRLAAGWVPRDGQLPPLTILNPDPGSVHVEPPRPLWKRLFGR